MVEKLCCSHALRYLLHFYKIQIHSQSRVMLSKPRNLAVLRKNYQWIISFGNAIYQSLELSDYMRCVPFFAGRVRRRTKTRGMNGVTRAERAKSASLFQRFQSILHESGGRAGKSARRGPRELSWAQIAAQIICQRNQSKGRVFPAAFFVLPRAAFGLEWLISRFGSLHQSRFT